MPTHALLPLRAPMLTEMGTRVCFSARSRGKREKTVEKNS